MTYLRYLSVGGRIVGAAFVFPLFSATRTQRNVSASLADHVQILLVKPYKTKVHVSKSHVYATAVVSLRERERETRRHGIGKVLVERAQSLC